MSSTKGTSCAELIFEKRQIPLPSPFDTACFSLVHIKATTLLTVGVKSQGYGRLLQIMNTSCAALLCRSEKNIENPRL